MSLPFLENQVISKANENIQTIFVVSVTVKYLGSMTWDWEVYLFILQCFPLSTLIQAMKYVVLYLLEIFWGKS